ncbi:extracellular solute-binding protein [Paenibacillus anaericanus]|uniref:Maltodextrin-binding protein n=1 Tax=Paenibacillus anaericanus TaxID=170367 RepID=A0A433Y8R6_9BACL|nr:extracellular solute-binding protein [Paenibacillus anaericanus]RUT46262.1 extracellular solute-binding protein [Paenibacillus anaericanus]
MREQTDVSRELVIWHEFDGPGDTSIEVLEQLCREYSQSHGIQVTPKVMNISELESRLYDVASTGDGPHMAFVPADMTGFGMRSRYSIVPTEICNLVESFGSESLVSMQLEGQQYGVPVLKGNHLVLYYNNEIYPEAPASWEEIRESGTELISKGITPIAGDFEQPYWFIPFLTAFGGWPLKEGRPNFLNDEMKLALQFVYDQAEAGLLESMNGSIELLERFIAGEVGAIVCGEWIFNYLDGQLGQKLGVGSLPSVQGRTSISMSSAIGLVYPNDSLESELREDILSFTSFMLSEASQWAWGTQVQRIPIHPVVLEQLMDTVSYTRRELISLQKGSRYIPISPYMNAVWKSIQAGLQLLLQQGVSIAFHTMEQTYWNELKQDNSLREKVEQ